MCVFTIFRVSWLIFAKISAGAHPSLLQLWILNAFHPFDTWESFAIIAEAFTHPFACILICSFIKLTLMIPYLNLIFGFIEIIKKALAKLSRHFLDNFITFAHCLAFKVFKKLGVKFLRLMLLFGRLQNFVKLCLTKQKQHDAVVLELLSSALLL